jgi:hypothetical protein
MIVKSPIRLVMLREHRQPANLQAKLHAELHAKLPSEKVCAKLEVLDKLEELDALNVGKVAGTGHMRSRSVCRPRISFGTRSVPTTLVLVLRPVRERRSEPDLPVAWVVPRERRRIRPHHY